MTRIPMEVQTRSETNGLKFHSTISDALHAAESDSTIWKVSFNAEDGTRIRLVKSHNGWLYMPIPNLTDYIKEN